MLIGNLLFENLAIGIMNAANTAGAVFGFMGESWENTLTVMSIVFDGWITAIEDTFGGLKALLQGDIGIGEFAKQFESSNLLTNVENSIKNIGGLELPVKIPLRDLGSELAALADRKDIALQAALAINTDAVQASTDSNDKAAIAVEQVGAVADMAGDMTTSRTVSAIEAGSLEAFRLEQGLTAEGQTIQKQQLDIEKKVLVEAKTNNRETKRVADMILELNNSLATGTGII